MVTIYYYNYLYKKCRSANTHLEVVAPPMISGMCNPALAISLATCTISSSEGVMRPDRPITSEEEQRYYISRIILHTNSVTMINII